MRVNWYWLAFPIFAALFMSIPLLSAQSFEIVNGNLRITSLDGLWRFHTGDNPAWADPNFDDSQWPLLHSTEGWSMQGYKDYGGMAWYRFQVTVPVGLDHAAIRLPTIETCYEIYADGNLIGTYGKMPPDAVPYIGGGTYRLYTFTPGKHFGGKTEIALRIWHWPGWARFWVGGPWHGGGLVGDLQAMKLLAYADRAYQFRSVAAAETLGLLEILAGVGALALFVLRRKEKEYLWFCLMMLFGATSEWIGASQSTHVLNVEFRDLVQNSALAGVYLASLAFYQTLLSSKREWLFKLALASIVLMLLNQVVASASTSFMGVWFDNLVGALCELVPNVWIITVVFLGVRQKSPDARLLIIPAILAASSTLFVELAWTTYILGWQHWIRDSRVLLTAEPFPVTSRQAASALFLLAVSGILILRFARARSEEERYAGEVQAARNVQQFLIPDHLPPTPGLAIESEYHPAHEVGGDFFQVLPDPADDSVLIVVGDVAGHGMEAGMLATLIVGGIRMATIFTTEPERILALLNKRMRGRGLATCLALRIERDGSAKVASAGHLSPYLNGRELEMEGALPLGAIPTTTFPSLQFKLVEGDALVLITDGVAEAQDAQGHLFGFERISEMLCRGIAASALASAAQAFGQEDDITVLSVIRTVGVEPLVA